MLTPVRWLPLAQAQETEVELKHVRLTDSLDTVLRMAAPKQRGKLRVQLTIDVERGRDLHITRVLASTKENVVKYPKLAAAAQLMEDDQGIGIAEWSDDKVIIALKARSDMDFVEEFLAALSDEDFNTLCVGEHDDMFGISNRDKTGRVHEVLDELFMAIGG